MLEATAISNGSGGGVVTPPGQQVFDTVGTVDWIVPSGITTISGCVIASGLGTGAGGGLSWRNGISVTPGETLQMVNLATTQASSGLPCGIKRGSEWLIVSYCGNWSTLAGGLGGKNASSINDGGGNGGNGLMVTLGSQGGYSGGGAGGYTGNGGNAPASGNGGGGGGGGYFYQSPNRYRGIGGGTGIILAGTSGGGGSTNSSQVDGKPGSNGTSNTYGGGINGKGGIRVIWGGGRSYPNNSSNM